jgi:aminoglycoside phosphotransferase (APT) family kinase protein
VADADRAVETAAALRTWLEREYGGTVLDAEAPRTIGTGFSTLIDYVWFVGRDLPPEWTGPLVARTHKTVEEAAVARREAAIQDWCVERAYPAPRVIAVFDPGELGDLPVQVMQRGPHATLFDAVKRAPWRAPRLVDRLAALQVRLHALPIEGWPEPDGEGLAERRLRLVRRWLAAHEDADLRAALTRVEPLLPELDTGPKVACHGDFHPLNVLVDGDESMVIDWTDAALGDRHGDVARTQLLFRLAAVLATSNRAAKALVGASQGWLSKRFLNAYQRVVPLDAERLRKWEAVHLLHGWAQIVEAHDAGGELADRVPIELIPWIRERFESALA